jgi:hypothetical protein
MLGTNTAVVGTLWKKLVNELNKRNIKSVADVSEFEHFIANCHIISNQEFEQFERCRGSGLFDSSVDGTMPNTASSNEPARTGESRGSAEAATTIGTDVQGGGGEKGGRSRKGKKG